VVGAVPDSGDTDSQLPVLVAVALKVLVPVTLMLCVLGFKPPTMYENDSVEGDAITVGGFVTVRLTPIVAVAPPVRRVIRISPAYEPAARTARRLERSFVLRLPACRP
jgi:hypothetical protein